MRIKICGITNQGDAKLATELGTWAEGFIFYPPSPRSLVPSEASLLIAGLPAEIEKVGVFVDEPESLVRKIAAECGLTLLQFHGSESPEYCRHFQESYGIIKSFRIKDENSLRNLESYTSAVDFILLDTFRKDSPGGTGETFDWDIALKAKEYGRPIILSGGLNPANVKEAIQKVDPYAVDASSGLESTPGKKDPELVKQFFQACI